MKTSFRFKLLSLILISFSYNVSAFEFSPYACTYQRAYSYNWSNPNITHYDYTTKLDWNQVSAVDVFMIQDMEGKSKLGVCSYFSSTMPGHNTINIKFITGNNLDVPSDSDCSFTGDISVELKRKEITQNEDYLSARTSYEINGAKFELLEIVGMQTEAGNAPYELCSKAFNEVTKNDPAPLKHGLKPAKKIKFKDFKRSKRI